MSTRAIVLTALTPALVCAASAQSLVTAACEARPTVTCVLALAREAGGGLGHDSKIVDLLIRSGDRAGAEALVRDLVARLEAEAQAASAQAQVPPKDQIEARRRASSGPVEARNRVWALIEAANLASKLGDIAATTGILERAQKSADAIADGHQRSLALAGMPGALMRAGDTSGALAMVERLRAGAAAPVGTTIAECAPGPSVVLRPVLDQPSQSLRLMPGTPSSMLKSLAIIALERGDIAKALPIIKAITDPNQCFDALKGVANARLRARDDAGAMSIANGLQNPWLRSWILKDISAARVFGGDRKGALDLARGIPDRNTRYDALATIAETMAKSDPAGALAMANAEQLTAGGQLRPRAEIAVAFAKKGDFAAARGILVAIRAEIAAIPDPTSRGVALGHLAYAYARTLDAEGFAQFVGSLDRQADQVGVLALLTVELARAGRGEPARRALLQALAITAAIPDAHERVLADQPLVEAETAIGDIAAAHQRVVAMAPIVRPSALASMVRLLVEARNHAEAVRAANAITNPRQRSEQLILIAEALAAQSGAATKN